MRVGANLPSSAPRHWPHSVFDVDWVFVYKYGSTEPRQPHTSKASMSPLCPHQFSCHFCASNTNLSLRSMDVVSKRERRYSTFLSLGYLPSSREVARRATTKRRARTTKPGIWITFGLCITGASLLSPQHTTSHMPALKMPRTYLSSPLPPHSSSFSHTKFSPALLFPLLYSHKQ